MIIIPEITSNFLISKFILIGNYRGAPPPPAAGRRAVLSAYRTPIKLNVDNQVLFTIDLIRVSFLNFQAVPFGSYNVYFFDKRPF
jgi:hypothetical protein